MNLSVIPRTGQDDTVSKCCRTFCTPCQMGGTAAALAFWPQIQQKTATDDRIPAREPFMRSNGT